MRKVKELEVKPIRVFEAFAGIGTQRMALRNLEIEHEVVGIAEIDKFAIKSYEVIHGPINNLGDISKIKTEDIPNHDLFTYSFPCQDISVAGKGMGLSEGSNTRSGLLWECERIIEEKKPKYLLMENVKNLVGKKFKPDFDKWLQKLEELGYTNYWQVLNAKDYGIPQNRERVFCVSILNDNQGYKFPEPFELKLRLKDLLEDEVEEKFYLSKEQVDRIQFSTYTQNKRRIQEKDYCDTLCARDFKDPKCVRITTDNKRAIENFRIRKLTPKEYWRLTGIEDEDFEKAQKVNSNSQLYKQAGNAIVVDVLEGIFRKLFKQEA